MNVAEHIQYELIYGIHKELILGILPNIKTEGQLLAMCTVNRTRKSLLQLYYLYPQIELLDQQEKKELKQYVLTNFKGDVDYLVGCAKCIYTINQLLNEATNQHTDNPTPKE